MTVIAETNPASKPARRVGRILSGLVIVFLMLDGAIKLVPWPVVTETMDKMASHVRIGSPLFTHTLFGLYLGLMLWGGLWLRDRDLRTLIPFRR